MTVALGKYRLRHTWSGSSEWGVHEELLLEGAAAGRGWAVVRRWCPKPRYRLDRGESYVLRIDISEWFDAYAALARSLDFAALHRILDAATPPELILRPPHGIWFDNVSPGWWENGFGRQLCLSAVPFRYDSEEDRIRSVVETGRDWDSLDYGEVVSGVCGKLGPLFGMLAEKRPPAVPWSDDF